MCTQLEVIGTTYYVEMKVTFSLLQKKKIFFVTPKKTILSFSEHSEHASTLTLTSADDTRRGASMRDVLRALKNGMDGIIIHMC